MIRRLRNKRGFTLVELMIVVAIIGILAALAIYGVKKYLTNAKTGEAKNNIGRLAKDAITAYEKETMAGALLGSGASVASVHQVCPSVTAAVPAAVPAGQKTQPAAAEWNTNGWPCLKFSITSPTYYQYNYTSVAVTGPNAGGFAATATGNLDGAGATSIWTYRAGMMDGILRLAPTIEEPANPED